ncbi:MAG: hypothetical protein PHV06_08840 [bacterium]|nr:hypothetical protein [bacterium]
MEFNYNTYDNEIIEEEIFGFLYEPISLEFEGFKIFPKEDYEDRKTKWIDKYKNKDGYLYPDLVYEGKIKIVENNKILHSPFEVKKVENSEKPANIHRLPSSHIIKLNKKYNRKEFRLNIGAFILNSIAFLYGTKLHFENWWVIGKVPMESFLYLIITIENVKIFMEKALKEWNDLSEENKKRINSILFLFNFSSGKDIELYFEKFLLEYMIMDGMRRIIQEKLTPIPKNEEDKLPTLAKHFNLHIDLEKFNEITNLRNNFVHESCFDLKNPYQGESINKLFYITDSLKRFNHRLITAFLIGKSNYTKSDWTIMRRSFFDMGMS